MRNRLRSSFKELFLPSTGICMQGSQSKSKLKLLTSTCLLIVNILKTVHKNLKYRYPSGLLN